jgi:hypothetical protein
MLPGAPLKNVQKKKVQLVVDLLQVYLVRCTFLELERTDAVDCIGYVAAQQQCVVNSRTGSPPPHSKTWLRASAVWRVCS